MTELLQRSATPSVETDRLAVDTLRFLAVDMVQAANSGHPGMPMGAAPMAWALWTLRARLGRPRSLRALGRARLRAPLRPAAHLRLRPSRGRGAQLPAARVAHARTSRVRAHVVHDRSPRTGTGHGGRNGLSGAHGTRRYALPGGPQLVHPGGRPLRRGSRRRRAQRPCPRRLVPPAHSSPSQRLSAKPARSPADGLSVSACGDLGATRSIKQEPGGNPRGTTTPTAA